MRIEQCRNVPVVSETSRLNVLVLLFSRFLTAAFASQCFFQAALLARLEVIRVTFYLFDDVFLLDLAFEAAQGVL